MFNLLKRWFAPTRGAADGAAGLDSKTASPSRNSTLHGATEAQSSVEPTDYPAEERQAQVDTATGRPGAVIPPPD